MISLFSYRTIILAITATQRGALPAGGWDEITPL
jgi:hypothetical protein